MPSRASEHRTARKPGAAGNRTPPYLMAESGVTDELRAAVAHLRLELARLEGDAEGDADAERCAVSDLLMINCVARAWSHCVVCSSRFSLVACH